MSEIGDYRIIKKLGEDTFAEVLQARNKRNGKLYALKRFKKQFRSVEEIESLREIQALRRLNLHPNIIQLEEVIFDAKYGILSLSFEMMDCNLYDVLSKKGQPPINESRSKWIIWQVMKALDFVHGKGVFHRDIKPENILVRGDVHAVPVPFPSSDSKSHYSSVSSFPLVKLADFGSCRGIHSRMPYTEYIATRWYRSPECLLFDGIYTYKMDMWGIGCVLYELVTKLPLFPGDNELDQLHKIHHVFGTPSERLLNVMVAVGTQALLSSPDGKSNPKAAGRIAKGIWKQKFSFPPTKGCGLRAVFPQHILAGAHKVPLPKNSSHSANDYPGITDTCINLMESLLQYDADARPTARQTLKHAWLKDCIEAELLEKQVASSMRDISPAKINTNPDSPLQVISQQQKILQMSSPTKQHGESLASPVKTNAQDGGNTSPKAKHATQNKKPNAVKQEDTISGDLNKLSIKPKAISQNPNNSTTNNNSLPSPTKKSQAVKDLKQNHRKTPPLEEESSDKQYIIESTNNTSKGQNLLTKSLHTEDKVTNNVNNGKEQSPREEGIEMNS